MSKTKKPTDKQRLDWLTENAWQLIESGGGKTKWECGWFVTSDLKINKYFDSYGSNPRAAIDAAMKQERKRK